MTTGRARRGARGKQPPPDAPPPDAELIFFDGSTVKGEKARAAFPPLPLELPPPF